MLVIFKFFSFLSFQISQSVAGEGGNSENHVTGTEGVEAMTVDQQKPEDVEAGGMDNSFLGHRE